MVPAPFCEAARLKTLADASILVPDVLEIGDDFIILSDVGIQLSRTVLSIENEGGRRSLLEQACKTLANLHNQGLVHGRPHLKDMTMDAAGEIYLIDLEEDPLCVMTLQQAQARDIWLFLCSIFRICGSSQQDLAWLFRQYKSHLTIDIDKEIKALAKMLKPYMKVVSLIGPNRFGRDVSSAYWATIALEQMKFKHP